MSGRKITFLSGERKGTTVDVPDTGGQMMHASGPNGEMETPMQTADRMSDSDVASNPGKQAQSTDHQNSY
jgi:hypothetical protein